MTCENNFQFNRRVRCSPIATNDEPSIDENEEPNIDENEEPNIDEEDLTLVTINHDLQWQHLVKKVVSLATV